MKVLVTGATGYIGSHTAAELHRRGHEVRVLARNPARVGPTLAALGAEAETAAGDMTDRAAVTEALRGCQAVVHAAGEVGVAKGTGATGGANLEGVRTVIGGAVQAGLDPIIYTSTVEAYLPSTDPVITPATPLATPLSSYGVSKRDAELLVRQWQDEGAPITTFTLGAVYGPISPHFQAGFIALLSALETAMLVPDGGLGVIDVRDLAIMFAQALQPGRGPRRYLAGGRFVTWAEWTEAVAAAAGKDILSRKVSSEDLIDLGRKCDAMRTRGEEAPPLSEEAAIIMTSGTPTDDSATLADLDCTRRPIADTFRDTVDWLREVGRLAPLPTA
jgi:nucleoside-diphosphate-sugar epimerase